MTRLLLIDAEGAVVNAVTAGEGWQPPGGLTAVPASEAPEGAGIGWALIGEEWQAPEGWDAEDEPEPVTEVSALQGKLALDDAGLYDAVESICATHPVQAVRLFWSSATRWERGHPVIAALALELDPPLSEAAVDALFEAAALK